MAATLVATPSIPFEAPARHRVTLEEYERMAEAGVFAPGARIELIHGAIVDTAAQGNRHIACVGTVTRLLVQQTSDEIMVMPQCAIRIPDDSFPEPDFSLVRATYDRRRAPGPEDILLVIEVSDSSLRSDRAIKLPLYAAAGIPEAWIFDLVTDHLERHTSPGPRGYREVTPIGRGGRLGSTVLPSVEFVADEVLGPPADEE